MFEFIKNIFKKESRKNTDTSVFHNFLTVEKINSHFDSDRPSDEFNEDTHLIENIRARLNPNRKNVFILDDQCDIVKIIEGDFKKYLIKINRDNEFNIITICKKTAGFDLLSIVRHPDIKIDVLMSDIIFGGNEKINGEKMVVDGVDLAILTRSINPNSKHCLFTGMTFGDHSDYGVMLASKYEKYFGKSMDEVTFIKDANVVFDNSMFSMVLDRNEILN